MDFFLTHIHHLFALVDFQRKDFNLQDDGQNHLHTHTHTPMNRDYRTNKYYVHVATQVTRTSKY